MSSAISSNAEAIRRSPGVLAILNPKWQSFRARVSARRTGKGARTLLILLLGGFFWAALFGVSFRILRYIKNVEEIGPLMAGKMLAVALLASPRSCCSPTS
jgi:hypothetical protein